MRNVKALFLPRIAINKTCYETGALHEENFVRIYCGVTNIEIPT